MHTVSLGDFLRFSLRHRGKILTSLVATVAMVLAATFLMPPTYEASSLVLVKLGREYVYRAEVGDRGTITPATVLARLSSIPSCRSCAARTWRKGSSPPSA